MSTRCQIGFYERDNHDLLKPDALLYRHSDGYPEGEHGVLAAIVPFLKEFHQRRGLDDTEGAAAWTLHHLIDCQVKQEKAWAKKHPKSNLLRDYGVFGICSDFHGDIEFYYAVRGTELQVYEVVFTPDHLVLKDFELVNTVNLETGVTNAK